MLKSLIHKAYCTFIFQRQILESPLFLILLDHKKRQNRTFLNCLTGHYQIAPTIKNQSLTQEDLLYYKYSMLMNILSNFHILFYCFFIAQCYASNPAENKTSNVQSIRKNQNPSLDELLEFRTNDCYQICNLHEQNDLKFLQATIPILFDAEKKFTETPYEAIALWNKLACQGDTYSAIKLGKICFDKEKFDQAVKWYVFAFQFKWIANGQKDNEIIERLKNIITKNPEYKSILEFVKVHTENIKQSLINLKQNYIDQTVECYIQTEERNQKIKFIEAILIQKHLSPDELWAQIDEYYDTNRYEEAAGFLKHLKTPLALYNLGVIYEEGSIDCKNGLPNYEKAAEYFRASKTPEALGKLGLLYTNGHIGGENRQPNYEEAAKCFKESKMPDALNILGTLYMDGHIGRKNSQPDYAKAAEYFRASKTPEALGNLGLLYTNGHIGDKNRQPNYKKAAKCFKESKTPEALGSLGLLYMDGHIGRKNSQQNYQKAAEYFKESKTPNALNNLGILYAKGHVGGENGKPNYQEAAKYFKASKSPAALGNLGALYKDGYIGCKNGQPNYEEAAECFKESKIPEALYNLGLLHMSGHIGRKNDQPNYEEAEKYFSASNFPEALYNIAIMYSNDHIDSKNDQINYEKARQYYESSKTPQALNNLGILYRSGKIGCKNDGLPNYEAAENYFKASSAPEALCNLGLMYMDGHISKDGQPNIAKAWQSLESAGLPVSLGLQALIIEQHPNKVKELLKQDNLVTIVQKICTKLEKKTQTYPRGKREMYQGIIVSYRDGNYNQAMIHLQNSLALGCLDAMYWIERIEVQTKLQELAEQETEERSENQPELSNTEIALSTETTKENIIISKTQKYKPVKSVATKKEKHLKNLAKINQKIMASCGKIEDQSMPKPQTQKPLEVSFINPEIEKDYHTTSLTSAKIIELMSDIEHKPYGTEGAGKPEVLKGKYNGHKGCISRRLNHEDRLVYKVTGPRQILILSCKGHY